MQGSKEWGARFLSIPSRRFVSVEIKVPILEGIQHIHCGIDFLPGNNGVGLWESFAFCQHNHNRLQR